VSRLYKPARPIEVQVDEEGRPLAVLWRGALYYGRPCNQWRIHTGWWDEEVWRDYYQWEGDGLVCEMYRDRLHDGWYMHRVYD